MYRYIVNPSSGGGDFSNIQNRLKAKLRELDIDGEFAKMLEADDAKKITRSLLKRDCKTIVVAGDDKTVNDVIDTVNASGRHSVSIGIIPLGDRNVLAQYLGIGDWQQACEILAARRLLSFNLIHINDYSFVHSCLISPVRPTERSSLLAEIDGEYKLRGDITEVDIRNQKLLNLHLPNQLLLRMPTQYQEDSWWQKLTNRQQSSPLTQLHARVAILEFEDEQTAVIDGRSFTDTMFRVRLSDTPVKLIAAKQHQQRFDSE